MKPSLWTKGAIFATFIGCCVVLALLSSSLATENWVTATGVRENNSNTAEINLGLFKGLSVKRNLEGGREFTVKLVCLTNDTESACMYSCGATPEKRTADLADLLYQDGSTWDQDAECKGESVTGARRTDRQASAEGGGGAELMSLLLSVRGGLPPTLSLGVDSGSPDSPVADVPYKEPQFMSYGLWLSTIIMLGAAIAFTLVAAMFAILNTATTPVETIFGVLGLYVWNAIAMAFELLALSLWGAQFHQHLQHSVLWREEAVQQWTTDGMASLGYSYWLVFVAMFLHVANMGILWFGTHQMRPKTVQVPVEREPNAANMIY